MPLGNVHPGLSRDPDSTGVELNTSNSLCDHLWDIPGSGSLPELADHRPSSPVPAPGSSFSEPPESVFEFSLPVDTAVDFSQFFSLSGPPQQDENDGSACRDFSPSAIVRRYPPTSQSNTRDFMPIPRPLNSPSWTLIEYYFKEVAALFSSYDSQMNPFRSTVSRLWGSSLAICRTMQSMAAATLVNDFPQFGPMGRKMRDEAVDIITREAVMDDKALLALLMLGQTASWHDPNDLGISFFNLLRKQIQAIATASDSSDFIFTKSCSNNYRFFEEALIYWEMLLSFVTDNDSLVFSDHSQVSSMGESLVLQRVPHPWTGIARDAQSTVHEVGRLVRRERKRIRARHFTSQDDILRAQKAIEKARELEERLLDLAHPTEVEIVSPGDDETPVWHLLTMAEMYRCTGLMQLYRAFPDLLRKHLSSSGPQCHDTTASASQNPFFPIDLDSMNMSSGFPSATPGLASSSKLNPAQNDHTSPSLSSLHNIHSSTRNQSTSPDDQDELYDKWLTEFAVTILSRLKDIPLESRTRCLQPFLLVASCSELRFPSPPPQTNDLEPNHGTYYGPTENGPAPDIEIPNVPMEAVEVSQARRFILGRLTSFLHVLPPKPINVCLRLVSEVWKRMDSGQRNTYWIDVMIEKGWETTMG